MTMPQAAGKNIQSCRSKIRISPTVGNSSGSGGNEITSTTGSHPPSTDFDRKPLHLPQYTWHTTAEIHEEYATRTRYTHLQKVTTIKYSSPWI